MKRLIIRPWRHRRFHRLHSGHGVPAHRVSGNLDGGRNVPLARVLAQHARSIASTGLDLLEVTGPSRTCSRRCAGSIRSSPGMARTGPSFAKRPLRCACRSSFFPALPPAGMRRACGRIFTWTRRARSRLARAMAFRASPCGAVRGNVAAIHPFAGSAEKRWPLKRFQELAQRLARRMPVEWCAGPEDELPGARRFDDLLRSGLLAGRRAGLHRQRFRPHPSGGGRGHARGGIVRAVGPGGVGSARTARERSPRRLRWKPSKLPSRESGLGCSRYVMIPRMFCHKCGTQVSPDVQFCPACGASLAPGGTYPGRRAVGAARHGRSACRALDQRRLGAGEGGHGQLRPAGAGVLRS